MLLICEIKSLYVMHAWPLSLSLPLIVFSFSPSSYSFMPRGHLWFWVSSSTMEQFATTVSSLALNLAEILAEKLGHKSTFFQANCLPSTCYLRLNRYPPCPIPSEVYGLMPHTDSDFLTILHQDQVGGLQLVKDGRWIAVKPNPAALIINIGDLFQVNFQFNYLYFRSDNITQIYIKISFLM